MKSLHRNIELLMDLHLEQLAGRGEESKAESICDEMDNFKKKK